MNIKNIATTYVLPAFALLVLSSIIFYPQLQNKSLVGSDIVQYAGMSKEMSNYKKETGNTLYWTNAMFGGMPTYQISSQQNSNLLRYVDKAMSLFIQRPIGLFFLIMFCAYLALLLFKSPPWVAFFGAVAIGLSVSNFQLYGAGHTSKLKVLGYAIPLFMGVYIAYQKNRFAGLALYAAALGLALLSNHPQMLYYLMFSLIIYGIIALIDAIRNNKLAAFGVTTAWLALFSVIALASSAANILPTLEYTEDTMRGKPLLTTSSSTESMSSEVDGLDWTYATNWSNGPMDLIAGYIPGVVGDGSNARAPKGSQTVANLRKRGNRVPDDMRLPLYWGALEPSTGGAFYFGAVVLFFLFLQFFIGSKNLSTWLALSLVFMAMISLGRNLEWFNRILFDYFPLHNKFRTPNSISALMTPIIGLGAAFGLHQLVTTNMDKRKLSKAVLYAACPLLLTSLFFMILGPGLFDFEGTNDAFYAQKGFDSADLIADRKTMMRRDALRSLIFVALAAGGAWAYATNKIKQSILIPLVIVLTIIDQTGVGRRYLSNDEFQSKRKVANSFEKRPADIQILNAEKNRGAYRVFDQSINTFNSARTSYYHNTIGGYSPAKLQRFEDIKNSHIFKGSQGVLNMLNTKYYITKDQKVQQNPAALGNAWFVNAIDFVSNNDEEIQALTNLNPAQKAIVHNDFQDELSGLQPTGSGTINMTEYSPDKLKYTSNTTATELAVFSEVWYGPDKGWRATIDGQPANIIRVNYLLRGLKIPPGNHEIIMEFNPTSVKTGNLITLLSSLLIIGFVAFILFDYFKKNRNITSSDQNSSREIKSKSKPKSKKKK